MRMLKSHHEETWSRVRRVFVSFSSFCFSTKNGNGQEDIDNDGEYDNDNADEGNDKNDHDDYVGDENENNEEDDVGEHDDKDTER